MDSLPINMRETVREERFSAIWAGKLNTVFSDIAQHYDIANYVASLGWWGWLRRGFIKTIVIHRGERVLDVCAGTNAIGIALLEQESTLEIHAMDQNVAMQEVGMQHVKKRGFIIHSTIGDVHTLPFPDNHFDIVTLQFASRHLRVRQVFSEIQRVLKPGGRFHHCDMLRPTNHIIAPLYYGYLRFILWFTAVIFRSGDEAMKCQQYFVNALKTFYSVAEFSALLQDLGYTNISEKSLLLGTIGYHRAIKPSVIT